MKVVVFGATGMVGQGVLRECLLSPATGRRHANAYMFRPGYIHPMNGEKPRSRVYRALLPVPRPLYPVLRRLMRDSVTTTENLGRAMIAVAGHGGPKKILENPDINDLGGNPAAR